MLNIGRFVDNYTSNHSLPEYKKLEIKNKLYAKFGDIDVNSQKKEIVKALNDLLSPQSKSKNVNMGLNKAGQCPICKQPMNNVWIDSTRMGRYCIKDKVALLLPSQDT